VPVSRAVFAASNVGWFRELNASRAKRAPDAEVHVPRDGLERDAVDAALQMEAGWAPAS
jgi:hypothetical protein